jgi:hypothetical protein
MKGKLIFGAIAAAALTIPQFAHAQDAAKPGAAKPAAKTTRARGTAYVRVLHAIVGGPRVDVYVDGKKTLDDVAFKTISDYMAVPSGQRAFSLNAATKTEVLLTEKKNLVADKYYTVAATTTAGKPSCFVQNESTGTMKDGLAQIRVFHLAAGAPAVDITTPSTRPNAKGGYARLMTNIAFKKAKSNSRITPKTYTLQVRSGEKLLREVPNVQVEAGKRYSVFAVGKTDGTGDETFDVLVKTAGAK